MTKLHRKELKQDEIRLKVGDAMKSLSLHRMEIVYIVAIVIAVGVIAFAWSYYERRQSEASQQLLGKAMEKLQAPVGEQPAAATKPEHVYKSESEKYSDALKDFEKIAQQYGNTSAADMARYQAGVCAFYLKDYSKSEQYLKQSGHVSEKNILYYLSRITLVDLYNANNKSDQAIQVMNEAVSKNKDTVPPETLLIKLAQSYQKAGKANEAKDTYQKIVDQYKESPVTYEAQIQLAQLKKK